MKAGDIAVAWRWVLATLLTLILIALALNWAMLLRIEAQMASLAGARSRSSDLPCAALPTRFVLDEPECAQRLLEAMNVDNVRVIGRHGNDSKNLTPADARHNEVAWER